MTKVKRQQQNLTETIEEVKVQKAKLVVTQKVVLKAIDEVKRQQNKLHIQRNAVTNLITDTN